MPTTTVGRKIALWVAVPMLVVALAAVVLTWRKAQLVIQHNSTEEAASLADLIATSFTLTEAAPRPKDKEPKGADAAHAQVAAAMSADFKILEHVRDLRVIGRDGVVRWSRRVEERGMKLPDAERWLAAPPSGLIDAETGVYARPLGGMDCARCHTGDAFKVGAVQVSVDRAPLADDAEAMFEGTMLALLVFFASVIFVAGMAMRRLVTRPLSRLTEVMHRAEKGDFLVRAKAESVDEIGRLANAFNSMLSKITEMKVAEIEASREMESLQRELKLKAELEQRIRDLTLLFDVTNSLNSTLELEEILKLVTELVAGRMGFKQFSVMLFDDKANELVVKASFGFPNPEQVEGFRLAVGAGASGLAAQTREPVYVRDLMSDARYVRGPFDPDVESSLLAIPMVCKEKVVGVLNVARLGKDAFTANEQLLLQLVGNQAAMAIVNARLFAETVELTLIDALTGTFNRRHLFSRLEMEIARAQRFGVRVALIMIDIDHFKHFNDTSGHPAGDKILREVAQLLKHTVRKVDTVARYGGEEFAVILPNVERKESFEVADKLRRAVEKTAFEHGERQPGGKVTISVGVSIFPEDAQSLDKLVDCADSALYASKRGGRNTVNLYSAGMESHPGRERGPHAAKKKTTEVEVAALPADPPRRSITGELAATPEKLEGTGSSRK